ncbi:hypothetical protein D7X33_44560 [Butyricicoccus sp. 1XD8-22]|nr:hypothetical protein D7X33_44560 [Butyricicoccus sp. 1XD8-22]
MSDTDWHKMGGPLLVSKPSILNGMTLYPETIGFVDTTVADPIGEMEKAIDNVTQVPGAMLGGFYHPYLGIGYLKEMVALLKDVPNLEWLELNETEQFVKTDLVKINYLDNGEIQIENGLTWQHDLKEYIYNKPFEVSLWVIVFVTAIFVAIFTFYIMTFRIRHRKRLFEER